MAVAFCLGASAQGRENIRINEVMVENVPGGLVDEYGENVAWIELFNTRFAPVNISSVFITNDRNNKKMYPVPLGDDATKIGKRQHIVFFADGQPTKGTLHTAFTLKAGQENWIGIYDANGETLLDSVLIPATVLPGQSWARTPDGNGEWEVRTGENHAYVTPASANVIRDTNTKIKDFAERDANGFGMTVMAMCIVFSALLVLCLAFYGIGKINSALARRNKARAQGGDDVTREEIRETTHDTGEEIAAIAMALRDHLEAHDTESTILTLKKIRRAYSPWSSKIYNLREVPPTPTHRR